MRDSRAGKALALYTDMAHRAFIAVLATVTLVLFSHAAHARGKGAKCRAEHDIGYGSFEALGEMLRVPPLVVNGDNTPRRLVGLRTPGDTEMLLGGGAAVELRCDYVLWQLVSLRYLTSLGGGGSEAATADDMSATAGRGGVSVLDIGLPSFAGIGGFELFPSKDSKVGARLDYGLERVWASGSVSGAGIASSPGSIVSWSFYARIEASACLRLGEPKKGDDAMWGCFVAAPMIYDQTFFPGFTAGFRMDL